MRRVSALPWLEQLGQRRGLGAVVRQRLGGTPYRSSHSWTPGVAATHAWGNRPAPSRQLAPEQPESERHAFAAAACASVGPSG